MSFSTVSTIVKLALLLAAGRLAAADSYTLQTTYDSSNFFDGFDFFDGADPTNGFVEYLSQSEAQSAGLAKMTDGGVFLGADSTTSNPANGRKSVRVSSKTLYTQMLLVADIAHMPEGCGTWPAFWTYGNNWPNNGEIDILEGVNSQASNEITLHTSEGCTMTPGKQIASTKLAATTDCGAGNGNTGCPQKTVGTSNYGSGFNAAGGGFYVMQWTDQDINVWFLQRNGSAAANSLSASAKTIDTSDLGTPLAQFSAGSGCDISSHFKEHMITLDTTFCGDWAGQTDVWNADTTCSALASTCQEYVANNPSAFKDAYWQVNGIGVYTEGGSTNTTSTTGSTPSSTPSSTTGAGTTSSATTEEIVTASITVGKRPGPVKRRVEKYRPQK